MGLSVVVSVYNSEKTIRDCLLSILNSDFGGRFEIIVVDDGSNDNSIEKIKDLDVKIIRQENRGAAAAKNAGARIAKGDLLVFVDSDVTFFKDTLKRIYEYLKKDNVDYVSARYSIEPLNQKWIHKYKALADYSYYYDFIFSREQKQNTIEQVIIGGGTEGYKKKVFEELGGFDERIKGADIERDKLILKLSQHYRMIADGKIRTRHNFPDFNKLVKNYFTRTLHFMDIVVKDNYSQPQLRKNTFRVILGTLTVISLVSSLALFLIFGYTIPFIKTLMLFSSYLYAHSSMFITAFKKYGTFFMLYALILNLSFCSIISLAGFLGTAKNLFRR